MPAWVLRPTCQAERDELWVLAGPTAKTDRCNEDSFRVRASPPDDSSGSLLHKECEDLRVVMASDKSNAPDGGVVLNTFLVRPKSQNRW